MILNLYHLQFFRVDAFCREVPTEILLASGVQDTVTRSFPPSESYIGNFVQFIYH